MRRVAFSALVVLAACSSGSDGTDDAVDARVPDASTRDGGALEGDFEVEVGTGLLEFEAITPGEELALVQGPQGAGRMGGYHIWMSVRIAGIDLIDVDSIALTITSSGGVDEAMVSHRPGPLPFEPCGDGQCAAGFAPRLADCCRVAGQAVTLSALVTAKNRRMVSSSVSVVAGACLDRDAPVCE